MPDDAGFYLVAWQIDVIASLFAESALVRWTNDSLRLNGQYGLEEDDFWPPTRHPRNTRPCVINSKWPGTRIFADKLREFGEHDLARQFQDDRQEFERQTKAAGNIFTGPAPRRGSMSWSRPWPTT